MAKYREPEPMSSEELLKRAWENIGRSDSGEPTGERGSSASGAMTYSANAASTASSADRALAAEEIARLLREEQQTRQRSGRAPQAPEPRRAPPRDLAPPRPRRTPPIEVPDSQLPPPPVPPRDVAEQGTAPPARRSSGRQKWLIFAAVWALLSIFGRFAGEVEISTDPNDSPVTLPATTEPVSLESSTLVSESSLEPGVCIVWLPPGENSAVATVPCAESHQYEVFAVVDLAAPSSDYSGPEDVYDLGYDACLEKFSDYVGEPYVDSPWYIFVIPPTEAQWVEEGDRTATCLLYQRGGDGPVYTEGTARGSGSPSA